MAYASFFAAAMTHDYEVARLRRVAESYGADPDKAVRDATVLSQTTRATFSQAVDAIIGLLGYEWANPDASPPAEQADDDEDDEEVFPPCSCEHARTGRPQGSHDECDPECAKCARDYSDWLSGAGDW